MAVERIIGIDCATKAERVGLAWAKVGMSRPHIVAAEMGARGVSIAERVMRWLDASGATLLAIDAPLGWPVALGQQLSNHRAGGRIGEVPDQLFLRETDRVVWRELGKKPLEVGADRIARTAVAAVDLLDELRRLLDEPIPLAWDPQFDEAVAAIEVYPAGTLRAHGLSAPGYKKPSAIGSRRALIQDLGRFIDLSDDLVVANQPADVLDAAVCCLAGWEFLNGTCIPPEDQELASKEGWIWVGRSDPSLDRQAEEV